MKTLANCDEIEFLRQTNKIRKAVQNWLTVTDIANIRENRPELKEIPKDASKEEKEEIQKENRRLLKEKTAENLDRILDSVLEEHPEETVQVMKLCCFVEPDDTTSHHITFYMEAFTEMFQDEDVVSFFQSLITLGKRFGLTA